MKRHEKKSTLARPPPLSKTGGPSLKTPPAPEGRGSDGHQTPSPPTSPCLSSGAGRVVMVAATSFYNIYIK